MGKPYADELAALANTYRWAMCKDIGALSRAVVHAAGHPLLAVGSGGSLSVAEFVAGLHETFTGRMAKPVTPLSLKASPLPMSDLSLLLVSAGGKNPDVLGTLKRAILDEPRELCVLTGDANSPLSRYASDFEWVHLVTHRFPFGKDGFLATNSLIAFTVLLSRAYEHVFASELELPIALTDLLDCVLLDGLPLADIEHSTTSLWQRRNLVLLHGPNSNAAAVDLESRFSEAALGSVQLADFRNFAHGRHHWLAKRGGESAVLAVVTHADRELADELLPLVRQSGSPVVRADVAADGIRSSLASLLLSLYIAGAAGRAQNIDPGRPGVPVFGRRIYNAGTLTRGLAAEQRRADINRPIERKSGLTLAQLERAGTLGTWKRAQADFVSHLTRTTFHGLVLDYDGTLCGTRDRYVGWSGEAPREVSRLLAAGVRVAIATGRGESVRRDLRRELSRELWAELLVGYHNGAEIAFLDDDNVPGVDGAPVPELIRVAAEVSADRFLQAVACSSISKFQISLRPRRPGDVEVVWTAVGELLHRLGVSGQVSLLRSGHAVDIIAMATSKRRVVEHVRSLADPTLRGAILCFGDQGAWPGNDLALLAEPYSLSSDEVSGDPATCWNLALAGYRGVQATVAYLKALEVQSDQTIRFRAAGLRRAKVRR